MKRLIMTLALICATLPALGAELDWLADVEAAQTKARRESKFVLLDFTGSDWCGWCMKLKKEVFDTPEFATFAKQNLVLVELDFPHHKPQSPAQKQLNAKLAQTLDIKGFPTIVVLDQNARAVGRLGYLAGGPKAFIAELQKIPGLLPGTPGVAATTAEPEPEPVRKPVEFVPIAPAVPNHYDQLSLKGISGTKDHRLAMINNQTLMVGETAKVKLQDERIEVCCKEIRDDSVLITANGKSMELKLGKR
ncbi:MAG: thioredoxin [Pedosphaera sp.]|nr:thioredoxin [Pedosphaera sp.]